ncbi:hypothetical protein CDEST_11309 [Colletotrichum destructivum]|uniref:Uncharacterized protein n=1 Tax=Colletotrichum destructivum TaxID=34406 RepID=A0AAX4IT10_9PEZI|nr:hypothetical protein CDEST_11309 [Colletotrichum destructivum]
MFSDLHSQSSLVLLEVLVIAGLAFLPLLLAQQFPLHKTLYESFGLTLNCFEALNTTLNCSGQLTTQVRFKSPKINVLNADGVRFICTAECKQLLQTLQSKTQNSCKPRIDIFNHNLVLYPGLSCVNNFYIFLPFFPLILEIKGEQRLQPPT